MDMEVWFGNIFKVDCPNIAPRSLILASLACSYQDFHVGSHVFSLSLCKYQWALKHILGSYASFQKNYTFSLCKSYPSFLLTIKSILKCLHTSSPEHLEDSAYALLSSYSAMHANQDLVRIHPPARQQSFKHCNRSGPQQSRHRRAARQRQYQKCIHHRSRCHRFRSPPKSCY